MWHWKPPRYRQKPSTVNAGTLLVNNTTGSGTGSGAVTVSSAGTLAGGGSVWGAVALSGGVSPGGSVGTLTTGSETWNGGGWYNWELIDANGTAGTGWDRLSVNGGIDIQATSESKFTIKVLSLDGTGAAGSVTNLNNDSAYIWGTIVTRTECGRPIPVPFMIPIRMGRGHCSSRTCPSAGKARWTVGVFISTLCRNQAP